MYYQTIWLTSDGEVPTKVFVRDYDGGKGWRGWIVDPTLSHQEIVAGLEIIWLKGAWHEISEAEALAKIPLKKVYTGYRNA